MELYHHGIKGQKWGVRRWQNSDGSLTSAGYIHYGYGKNRKKKSEETTTQRESKGQEIKRRTKEKIDDTLVKAGLKKYSDLEKTYGAMPLLDFATETRQRFGISSIKYSLVDALVDQGEIEEDDNYNSKYQKQSEPIKLSDKLNNVWGPDNYDERDFEKEYGYDPSYYYKKDNNGFIDQHTLEYINPEWGGGVKYTGNNGSVNNCVGCSLTTELLNKGYVGVSAGLMKYGNKDAAVEKYFKGSKLDNISYVGTDIDDYVSNNYGKGTSGYLAGSFTKSDSSGSKIRVGGHALHWQINDDGKIRITDGQTSDTFSSFNAAFDYYKFDRGGGTKIARLDNTEPDIKAMMNDGIIQSYNPSKRDAYKSKYSDDDSSYSYDYSDTRQQAKSDLYDAYKEYKKQYFN